MDDGLIFRRDEFHIPRDDVVELHEGVVRRLAELVSHRLDAEATNAWLAGAPRDARAFTDYLVGLGSWKAGELASASERFREALRGPEGGLAFTAASAALGAVERQLYSETKDPEHAERAERAFRQAAAAPSSELYRHWGSLEQERGDQEAAIEHYRKALGIDPLDYLTTVQLVMSYESLGDTDSVDRVLTAALEAQPNCWRIRNFLAKKQMERGSYAESENSLLQVIQLAPRHPVAYNNLAVVYFNEGRYQEGVSMGGAGDRAGARLILVRHARSGLPLRGVHRRCLGQPRVRCRTISGTICLAGTRLAQASYAAAGLSAEAVAALRRTVDLGERHVAERPFDINARCRTATAQAMLGRSRDAVAQLGALENLDPASDATALCAADVYAALGERKRALDSIRSALERGATMHEVEQSPVLRKLRAEPGLSEQLLELGLEWSADPSRPSFTCPVHSEPGLAITPPDDV